jgi:hypothetical protein
MMLWLQLKVKLTIDFQWFTLRFIILLVEYNDDDPDKVI